MKKQLAILLSGALLMSSLCGCGKNSGSEEKNTIEIHPMRKVRSTRAPICGKS